MDYPHNTVNAADGPTINEAMLKAKADASSMDQDPRITGVGKLMDEPVREIPQAQAMLDLEVSRLTDVTGLLYQRLQPVLHSVNESGEDRAARDFGSETARLIADEAYRVSINRQIIEKILNELQV